MAPWKDCLLWVKNGWPWEIFHISITEPFFMSQEWLRLWRWWRWRRVWPRYSLGATRTTLATMTVISSGLRLWRSAARMMLWAACCGASSAMVSTRPAISFCQWRLHERYGYTSSDPVSGIGIFIRAHNERDKRTGKKALALSRSDEKLSQMPSVASTMMSPSWTSTSPKSACGNTHPPQSQRACPTGYSTTIRTSLGLFSMAP
jgi:hypothetical protein